MLKRQQLRNSGKYQQIIKDPEAYLRQRGYGKENLKRLKESYTRYRNEQKMEQVQKKAESFAEESPFWSTVSTYPAEFVGKATSGLSAIGSGIEHTFGLSDYHGIDVNKPGYVPSVYSDTARDKVSEEYNDTQRLVYNGVNTFVDEVIPGLVLKGVSKIPGLEKAEKLGARLYDTVGAYGETAYDAAVSGATTNEGIAASTANAGIQWLADEIDVDNLLEIKSSEDWAKAANTIVGGVRNMSQEELAYIGNLVIETAFLAENSSFNQQVEALVQTGMRREEAKKTVYERYIRELEFAASLEYASDLLLD